MYFSSPNSRHLYGEAIDIINDGMSFDEIMERVWADANVIKDMLDAGLGVLIEQTTDDLGVKSKHYHFGTDKVEAKKFWDTFGPLVAHDYPWLAGEITNFQTSNTRNYTTEITHTTVEEA